MEVWKAVVGYEGLYEVSNIGRVRSLRSGKLRKIHASHGYEHVALSKDGKIKNFLIHVLVLTAFVGPKPGDEYETCHADNNRLNNTLENLRWGTRYDNAADKVLHGSDPKGSRNGRAMLTEREAAEIYMRAKSGEAHSVLADEFGISSITVSHIVCGRTWSHVTGAKHVRRRAIVTDDLPLKIKELKEDGKTLNEIAATLGISKATAFRHSHRELGL